MEICMAEVLECEWPIFLSLPHTLSIFSYVRVRQGLVWWCLRWPLTISWGFRPRPHSCISLHRLCCSGSLSLFPTAGSVSKSRGPNAWWECSPDCMRRLTTSGQRYSFLLRLISIFPSSFFKRNRICNYFSLTIFVWLLTDVALNPSSYLEVFSVSFYYKNYVTLSLKLWKYRKVTV